MIPKNVHLSWKTKDLLSSNSPLVTEGIKKLVELNPCWNVTIYDDQEIDQYLKDNLKPRSYKLIANKHIVQKTDLWRLIKLYKEGGVYIDIDRFVNTPLDSLIDDDTMWVVPTCRDYDFSHDFMMTSPQNPVYSTAVQLYLQRLEQGHTNVYFLGPQTYMHAITQVLMGRIINTDPGVETLNSIRKTIGNMSFIKTYREDPPYNTIVYRNDTLKLDWEQEKRKFYAESGLRHWSNEW